MDYVTALKRVRTLALARTAVGEALDEAFEDLDEAEVAEGRAPTVMLERHPATERVPPPRQRPPPTESGLRPKANVPEILLRKKV